MQRGVISSLLKCLCCMRLHLSIHEGTCTLKICAHLYYMTHDNAEISYVICQDDPSWPVNILRPCSRLSAINTLLNHFSFAVGTPRSRLAPAAGDATIKFEARTYCTTDGQSVSQHVLVSSTLVGLLPRYYFLSVCCCLKFAVFFLWGALSDERTGLQFAVQSLNGPSRSEPVTLLYCLIWDSRNLEGQVPVFISRRNRVAQLYPWALGSLYVVYYDSQGYGGDLLILCWYPCHGEYRCDGRIRSLHDILVSTESCGICCFPKTTSAFTSRHVGRAEVYVELRSVRTSTVAFNDIRSSEHIQTFFLILLLHFYNLLKIRKESN
jgi:hypothetical protein